MSFSSSRRGPIEVHPIRILDLPDAGYLLDMLREFQDSFMWPIEQETLRGLAYLASKRFSGLQRIRFASCAGTVSSPVCDALIRRLRLAGHIGHESGRGLALTEQGAVRLSTAFSARVRAAEWINVLDGVRDELIWYAESDSLPLTAR